MVKQLNPESCTKHIKAALLYCWSSEDGETISCAAKWSDLGPWMEETKRCICVLCVCIFVCTATQMFHHWKVWSLSGLKFSKLVSSCLNTGLLLCIICMVIHSTSEINCWQVQRNFYSNQFFVKMLVHYMESALLQLWNSSLCLKISKEFIFFPGYLSLSCVIVFTSVNQLNFLCFKTVLLFSFPVFFLWFYF